MGRLVSSRIIIDTLFLSCSDVFGTENIQPGGLNAKGQHSVKPGLTLISKTHPEY